MTRSEALRELLLEAHDGAAPSAGWEHAYCDDAADTDGTLENLWQECTHVEAMARLAYAYVDQKTLVRAAAAAARLALDFVRHDDKRLSRAVETAERWVEGDATSEEAAAAGDGAFDVVVEVNAATRFVARSTSKALGSTEAMAETAAAAATAKDVRPIVYDAAFAAADAAFAASETSPGLALDPAAYAVEYAACACERVAPDGRHKVADLMRQHLPAPTKKRLADRRGDATILLPWVVTTQDFDV